MISSAAEPDRSEAADGRVSRREFVTRAAAVSAGVAAGSQLIPVAAQAAETSGPVAAQAAPAGAGTPIDVTLIVNGQLRQLSLDPRATLLDALRDTIGLTGTKKGCDQGHCGACTVHVAGRPVLSCLTLAASANGAEVTTIEGLASGNQLHPMQRAFLDADAYQCGFCTPGMIMSAVALAKTGQDATVDQIHQGLSGNLCRCGAYPNIVQAVQSARKSAS